MIWTYGKSLAHFGIKGQKWGIRRFQNEDGSYTPEGKERYSRRSKDIEYAKKYAKSQIEKDKKSLEYWRSEVQKSKDMPATREGIKKRINISDDDYDDYLREYKTPENIKKRIISDDQHEAKTFKESIKDWNKKLKSLEKVKVDVIMSDKQHQKQIDDIFTQAQGKFFRFVELYPLHEFINDSRKQDKRKSAS